MSHVPLNKMTVLNFLQRKTPQTLDEIRFGLDAQCGCVYGTRKTKRVLDALTLDRKVTQTPAGYTCAAPQHALVQP